MDDAELIRRSFGFVMPKRHAFVQSFYKRWFRIHSEMRRFFPESANVPSQQLAAALTMLAENAQDLEAIRPALKKLGAAHGEMGIKYEYIHSFTDSLIMTFSETLGDDWGELQSRAWRSAILRAWEIMFEDDAASVERGPNLAGQRGD